MWVIAVARLAGSLPPLRWPFYGGIAALLVDQSDLFMMNLIDLGGVRDYQSFDKYLDQAYLLAFLVIALRWQGFQRSVAAGLYAYRFAGFAAFELTGSRGLLVFFPNLFEFWYLLVAGLRQFRAPEAVWLARRNLGEARAAFRKPVLAVLAGLVALKVFQEYAIHRARWLDGFTAVEAVEAIWCWLTPF
jgi:hypothetical protein